MEQMQKKNSFPFSPATKTTNTKEQLILDLFQADAIKFGSFTLKSGMESPIYIDLRRVVSFPHLLYHISNQMWNIIKRCQYDIICGVPYTGIPIATGVALLHHQPMIMLRKEAKDYGTKKMVEGVYNTGNRAIILDDVITNGLSKFETINHLKDAGLFVTDILVLVDRQQGAKELLAKDGYTLHAICTMTDILTTLEEYNKINQKIVEKVKQALDI